MIQESGFSCGGTYLRNSLPLNIRHVVPLLLSFRYVLKISLFQQYFLKWSSLSQSASVLRMFLDAELFLYNLYMEWF